MAEVTHEESTRSRISTFVGDTLSELRKVVWPKREESFNLTIVVLVVMVLVMIIISGLDSILSAVFETLLDAVG